MRTGRGSTSWAERGYDLLLHAYPRHYRSRFAPAMRDTLLSDHARVHATGVIGLASFWIVTVVQAVWFGTGERLRVSGGAPVSTPSGRPESRFRWSIPGDVRYALRLLARSPLFAVTAILSLAIGIAGATTIFGLADAVLLQASPGVRDSQEVVEIARTTDGSGYDNMSYPVFRHLRDHTRTLEAMAATPLRPRPLSMTDGTTSERVYGRTVSGSFFEVLKAQPALGRFFRTDEDEIPEARPVVVLSHRFWQQRLRSDPRVLDRPMRLNNREFAVIGVAEAGFEGTTVFGTDLWVPMAMLGTVRGEHGTELLGNAAAVWHVAVGRLKPGVTREAAQAELNTLLRAYQADTPAVPGSHGIVVARSGRLPTPMRLLFGAFVGLLFVFTGGLLAIACSNVAGMLLARATARHREMATRLAVGASRGQLLAQMLTETLVLFAAAALVALPVSLWLASALQAFLPALPFPIHLDFSVGVRTLLFAAAISLAAGVVFGLAPARHALGTDLSQALHGRSCTAGPDRLRLRHGLVVAQVALSLAMAITAGLFVRTLQAAAHIDPGFSTADIEIVSIDTTLASAAGPGAVSLVNRLAERVRTVVGVEGVALARMIPLQGGGFGLGGIRIPGLGDAAMARLDRTDWDVVSPDYFRTIGLPIVEGRAFTSDDRDGRPQVAIVNEAFARVAWPGRSAVGQRFWQTAGQQDEGRPLEVVGVAKDAKYRTISEAPRPFVYVPFEQHPQTRVELFVKHAPGRSISSELRAAIASIEPGLPVVLMQSFDDATALGLLPQRLAAWIAGTAGSIGMFLAALGLYGLVAFLVAQRTREIAIRMALGASQKDVRSMVLGQAARLGAIGAAIGLLLASGLGLLIHGLLVGVRPIDPVTFGGLALLMCAVLFAASLLPARRAASTDPAVALRAE